MVECLTMKTTQTHEKRIKPLLKSEEKMCRLTKQKHAVIASDGWLWHRWCRRWEALALACRVLVSHSAPTVCCCFRIRLLHVCTLNTHAHLQSWLLQTSNVNFLLSNAKSISNCCNNYNLILINLRVKIAKNFIFMGLWAPPSPLIVKTRCRVCKLGSYATADNSFCMIEYDD